MSTADLRPAIAPKRRLGLFLLALLATTALALMLRLRELDRFVTPDELKWVCRSINFQRGLRRGDLALTRQTGHPGVIVMWLGEAWMGIDPEERWLDACANPSLADLIETNPPEMPKRLTELLFRARRGMAVLTALAIALGMLLLARLLGWPIALLAGLWMAWDPFLLAHSRLFHLDAIISSLLWLAILCLALYWRAGNRRWLLASGALGALAALNKSPAMFILPFAGLCLFVACLWQKRPWRESLLDALALGLAFLIVYGTLWPAMWVQPWETLRTVFGTALFYASNPHTNSNYFMGTPRPDPGVGFYPIALLFRLTPWGVVGLVLAALFLWRRDVRDRTFLVLVSFIVLYGAFMTLGQKKFDRYLLPVFPAVDTLAAAGLLAAGRWLTERFARPPRSAAVALALGGVLLALGTTTIMPHAPYYLTYYNPLLGGGRRAVQTILVGWGEGLDEAARFLNALPDAEADRTSSRSLPGFAAFYKGTAYDEGDYDPATTDYVVIYLNEVQRQLNPDLLAQYYEAAEPIHVVRLHGIDYAWIYANRTYQPPMEYIAARALPGQDAIVVSRPSLFDRYYRGSLPLYVLRPGMTQQEIMQELQEVAKRAERVWYVRYDEKNPNPTLEWLDFQWRTHAFLLEQGTFAGLQVLLWQISEEAPFALETYEAAAPDLRFGDKLRLMGRAYNAPYAQWGRDVGVLLDWEVLADLDKYYAEFIHVVDRAGRRWGQGDRWMVDGSLRPTVTWRQGDRVADYVAVRLVPGIPPGEYELALGLYDRVAKEALPAVDDAGQPIGDRHAIGTLRVQPSLLKPAPDDLWIPHRLDVELAPGLVLLGWGIDKETPRFGETPAVALYWHATRPLGKDYAVRLSLVGEGEQVLAEVRVPLAGEAYPSSRWEAGETLWRYCDLALSPDVAAEEALLRLALLDAAGEQVGAPLELHKFFIDGHRYERPPIAHPQGATLGDTIRLLGYDLQPEDVSPGKQLTLTLYWQATAPLTGSYTVFTHLLGPDGALYGQHDGVPREGSYPTNAWRTDEYIVDRHVLEVSEDAPVGGHRIEIGMYDPQEGARRLPLVDDRGVRQPDDCLFLETAVRVE